MGHDFARLFGRLLNTMRNGETLDPYAILNRDPPPRTWL